MNNRIYRIRFGKRVIKFAIIRSDRRKTVAIGVSFHEGVIFRAPHKMKIARIYNFVKKKSPWIIKNLSRISELDYPAIKHEFVSGESFSYLGRHARLCVKQNKSVNKPVVFMHSGYFDVILNNDVPKNARANIIRTALVDWHKKHALEKLNERAGFYARKIGILKPVVAVRDQNMRWGSCDAKRVMRLNWRIIMAPISVVDYVVTHELCHLKHSNHSPQFWNLLHAVMPDCEDRRRCLRLIGPTLTF